MLSTRYSRYYSNTGIGYRNTGIFLGRKLESNLTPFHRNLSTPINFKPYLLVIFAGLADISTSLIGWNMPGLHEVGGGTFLWIPYWLLLIFTVRRVQGLPKWMKFWFARTTGILCFIVPISNLLLIIHALV